MARNLHDLDAVRDELGRLERTDTALRTFLADYRRYLTGVLRTSARNVSRSWTSSPNGAERPGTQRSERAT